MKNEVPEFYKYIHWYDLDNMVELYAFMQEFLSDITVDINDYPDIKTYYKMLCDNALKEDCDLITTEYVAKKLKNTLINYGFAHTTKYMAMVLKKSLFYYWNCRKE